MVTLRKDDIYDKDTLTYDLIQTLDTEEKTLQELLSVMQEKKDYMISFLRENETIPLEVWNTMSKAFDYSTLDSDEIYDMGKKMLRNYFMET